ncbi:MAG: hypothetical protein QXW79_00595 [Thermoplasmata archaeon]
MNTLLDYRALLAGIVFLVIYLFGRLSKSEAVYVISEFDGRPYLVQNLDDKKEASYILSIIYHRIILLRNYLVDNREKFPEFKNYIEQFSKRIEKLELQENAPNGKYTSYTTNKEEISICLRSKKDGRLHDINLVMYVVLHELAHIACPEMGHTKLFREIFAFFLKTALKLKIYKKVNFHNDPHEYCGMVIKENLVK